MSAEQLVMIVKAGQRSNQEVKNRWAEYCLKECDGTKDPAKHSAESLGNFLHMIEAEFQHESWYQHPESVPSRATVPPPGVPGGPPPPGDPLKPKLVLLIKAGQRQSQEWKNDWGTYANENLNSVKDPNAHDGLTLQGFIDLIQHKYAHESWYQSPEEYAPPPRDARQGPDMGPGKYTNASGCWNGNFAWMHADPSMPAHPELVQMIKERQRADPNFKECWGQFCDSYCEGIRDPCRHPSANVIQFLEMQGHLPKGGFQRHFQGLSGGGGGGGSSARGGKATSPRSAGRSRFNPY